MKSVDIINVAGLLMDGKDDGMEKELRKLNPRSLRTVAPTPLTSAREHPSVAIERLIEMIQRAICEIQQKFGESNVFVVGRSYGGFMALQAAIAMNFENILRLVSIEGPLHPDVFVCAPALLPPLMMCGVHYDARSVLAQEALDRLETLPISPLVLIQGGAKDSVVPNDAQILPGDFETVEFSGESFPHSLNCSKGLIVRLSENLHGHNNGVKRFLPAGYRNHLSWSDEKMQAMMAIIQGVSAGAQDL